MAMCQWKPVESPNGREARVCQRCGTHLVNMGTDTLAAVLARQPNCEGPRSGARTRPPVRPRGLVAKVRSYGKALSKWRAAGRPMRSYKEVERIYWKVCMACAQFSLEKATCKMCDCKVNRSKVAMLNKIRMATESCPDGKWGELSAS